MQELDPCRKLAILKPEGNLKWLESAEEDQKKVDVRNRKRKQQDREQWVAILGEAKVHQAV